MIERGSIACSTTGRCSCDQHSGARYAVKDKESAIECIEENQIARRIMPPGVMVENDGLFILLGDDDQSYADRFFAGCAECGIPAQDISPYEILRREPNLTKDIRRVGLVPDAVVEPYRYAMSYAATAKANGARFLLFTELIEMIMDGSRVAGVRVRDRTNNQVYNVFSDLVLNAAGPWAGKVAALAGINIPLSLSPGVHLILNMRLTHLAINRMRMPGSGDWIAPVRNHSILGTSSWSVAEGDYIYPRQDHVQQMREECGAMVPLALTLPVYAVNAAARPLLAASGKSERELSRTFECFDHTTRDQIDGFVTITGGKLCTARAMAEKTADVVCQKLGISAACKTRQFQLVSYRSF